MSNTLADFADDDVAGRYPVVQEIKALTREIAATYQELAVGSQQLAAKPTQPTPPSNPMEALRQMQNVLTNISKWKAKLANADTPDERIKAEQKLQSLAEQKNTLAAIVEAGKQPAPQSPST